MPGAQLNSCTLIYSSVAGLTKLAHGLKLGCYFENQFLFMFGV